MPDRTPGQRKPVSAKYRLKHREQIAAYRATYRATHQDERRQAKAQDRANHPERVKDAAARWYKRHREEVKAYCKAYRQTHKAERAVSKTRRRAIRHGLPATLTAEQWQAIKRLYKHRCAYCDTRGVKLTQDHVIPLSKGGGTIALNIVPACGSCNSKKHTGAPPTVPAHRLLI